MLIEQPPLPYRLLFPEAIWRIKRKKRRVVYLTFDDGPIPEVTPWVLDLLDSHGFKTERMRYMRDITEADTLIDSPLFRPPHGLIRWSQAAAIKNHYNIVMYDLVTRDYSYKMTPDRVLANVRRYARNGSIIVFHDSLRAERNLREALPAAIEWLKSQGYEFLPIPM